MTSKNNPASKPIIVNGVRYDSVVEASRVHGMSVTALRSRVAVLDKSSLSELECDILVKRHFVLRKVKESKE